MENVKMETADGGLYLKLLLLSRSREKAASIRSFALYVAPLGLRIELLYTKCYHFVGMRQVWKRLGRLETLTTAVK